MYRYDEAVHADAPVFTNVRMELILAVSRDVANSKPNAKFTPKLRLAALSGSLTNA